MSHAVDLLSPIFPQEKSAGDAQPVYALAGKLYLSSSGWLMLSVPNALAKGAFDALQEPGVELPPSGPDASFNAHISVARPEELAAIGGGDKISERGHTFRYNIGRIRTTTPAGWPEMSRVWFIEVKSPELEQLRKSYGLSAKPKDNQYEFHISFAVRRRRVLLNGSITKASENYHAKTIEVGQLGAGDQSAGVGQVCEDDGKQAGLAEDIDAAGQLTNTSPTPAQQEAGNYAKGKVQLHGMTVSIENPKGSTRSGTSKDGRSWSVEMKSHYGYIGGTKGKDGDHVDVFIGDQPESELVVVVDQIDPGTGKFDEVKCMLGFVNTADAVAGYLANYAKNWQGMRQATPATMEQFKDWLENGDMSKPFEESLRAARVKKAAGISGLAADEGPLSQSEKQAVSSLRRPGDKSVPALVEFIPSVLPGHGATTEFQTSAGTEEKRSELLSTKLLLGYLRSSESKQAEQRVDNFSGTNADTDRLGSRIGNTERDAPVSVESLRMVGRASSDNSYGRAAEKCGNVNSRRQNDVYGGLGERAEYQIRDAKESNLQGVVGGGSLINLSKEAEQFAARALTAQLSNPTWDASQGVASNLLANVSQFRQRGKAMIQHRRSAESLQAAIDPNYGYQRLADQFAGRYHDPATPTESLLFESAP